MLILALFIEGSVLCLESLINCFQPSSVLRMPGNVWYDFAGLFSN